MPAGLWGRAESVRTVIRSLAQALAPLMFGGMAELIAGIFPKQTPIGTSTSRRCQPGEARGLEIAFLMLVSLAAAGSRCCARATRMRATWPRPPPPIRAPVMRFSISAIAAFSCDGRLGQTPIARGRDERRSRRHRSD